MWWYDAFFRFPEIRPAIEMNKNENGTSYRKEKKQNGGILVNPKNDSGEHGEH